MEDIIVINVKIVYPVIHKVNSDGTKTEIVTKKAI